MIKLIDFKKNAISIFWKTTLVGRTLKLVDTSFIDDFATQYLLDHYKIENKDIIELSYGVNNTFEIDERVQKILSELNQNVDENSEEWNTEKRKWRFLVLQELLSKSYHLKIF